MTSHWIGAVLGELKEKRVMMIFRGFQSVATDVTNPVIRVTGCALDEYFDVVELHLVYLLLPTDSGETTTAKSVRIFYAMFHFKRRLLVQLDTATGISSWRHSSLQSSVFWFAIPCVSLDASKKTSITTP